MIEELYSNTIYYGNAEPLNVNIHLKINNETLEVVYEDNGKPFNPLIETEPPNFNQSIEDRQIGGLGIHFIKSMTDHQSYQRTNSLNQLTLKKKITPSTHAKR
jgi:anti-sigma regulatory factor (Ser/Thr protein kinase)